MRSTKSLILLVIAAGCGLIAALGFAQAMSSKGETVETVTIFVAADQVPTHTKLSAEHVKEEQWPRDKVPEGAARSIEEFEGLSPKYPLVPNEPIVLTRLSSGGDIASGMIPPGHQVMSVKVDKESALSGLVTPGDKVDVLVFIRGRSSSNGDGVQTATRTILRNITVFAVNDRMSRDPEAEATIDAKTVSLLVLPEQSERLLLAKQLGTIHLTLRQPGDTTNIATSGASPRDLLGEAGEGSDGLNQTTDEGDSGGLIDILNVVQAGNSKAVDTSTASVPGSVTVIMSPDGVLGRYTFEGSGLPSELLSGEEEDTPSESETSETVSIQPEAGSVGDNETGEVFDPSVLGL